MTWEVEEAAGTRALGQEGACVQDTGGALCSHTVGQISETVPEKWLQEGVTVI